MTGDSVSLRIEKGLELKDGDAPLGNVSIKGTHMNIESNIKLFTSVAVVAAAGFMAGCSSPSEPVYEQSSYGGTAAPAMSEPSGAQAQPSSSSSGYSASQQSYQRSSASQQQSSAGANEISIPLHEEKVNVGKHTIDSGQVTIRKVITTETVNQPVQLRKESIVIDHQPAGSAGTASSGSSEWSAPFQEKSMTIRLQSEEPVVQKQTVVKGNVVARRNSQTQQQNVQEQIRKENVEVDKGAGNIVLQGPFYEVNEAAGAQPQKQEKKEQKQEEKNENQQ